MTNFWNAVLSMPVCRILKYNAGKLSCRNIALGMFLAWLGPIVLVVAADRKVQYPNVVASGIDKAKKEFALGNRRAALQIIKALEVYEYNSSSDLQRLRIQKNFFLEQFYFAENFQIYHDLKVLEYTESWSDCIRFYKKISIEDRDNLLALKQKASCFFNAGLFSEASTAYFDIMQLDANNQDALFGLIQIAIARNQIDQAEKLMESLNGDIFEKPLLEAQILFHLGNASEAIHILQTGTKQKRAREIPEYDYYLSRYLFATKRNFPLGLIYGGRFLKHKNNSFNLRNSIYSSRRLLRELGDLIKQPL